MSALWPVMMVSNVLQSRGCFFDRCRILCGAAAVTRREAVTCEVVDAEVDHRVANTHDVSHDDRERDDGDEESAPEGAGHRLTLIP